MRILLHGGITLFIESLLGLSLPTTTSRGLRALCMACLGFGGAMLCGRHGGGMTEQLIVRMVIV